MNLREIYECQKATTTRVVFWLEQFRREKPPRWFPIICRDRNLSRRDEVH